MSLKKTSTRKKSVTWQDVSEQSSKSAAVEATSLSSQIGNVKQRNHNTPIIQFQLHNIPFHFLGIVYYFLYVDYEKLVKYETINSVLYKALPLTYLGQIVWLSLLHVTPPVNEKKKHISAQKSKRIEFNPTLIFAATYLSFLSSFVIYAIAVLLGSPILVFQLQTYLLSLHLAFLVTFPLIVIYKFNSGHWISLIVDISDYMFLISNPIYVVALLSAVGAWSGVLTIPLDWDRDWQMYPISLVLGAYFGGFVGGIIAFFSGFLRESKSV